MKCLRNRAWGMGSCRKSNESGTVGSAELQQSDPSFFARAGTRRPQDPGKRRLGRVAYAQNQKTTNTMAAPVAANTAVAVIIPVAQDSTPSHAWTAALRASIRLRRGIASNNQCLHLTVFQAQREHAPCIQTIPTRSSREAWN